MSYGDDKRGGPDYIGCCPLCGKMTGNAFDTLCDKCRLIPVVCDSCGHTTTAGQVEDSERCPCCKKIIPAYELENIV